ncbi:MAG: hypothetical protein KA171_04800, partial [Reyranella sp.]|nr:hypothetical protein [Reyranella sp.]
GSSAGGTEGSGIAWQRSTSSETGACRSCTCRNVHVSPPLIKFRRRSSAPSRPSARASLSMLDSQAKIGSTTPKPRIEPYMPLLVATAQPSIEALGTWYGPWINEQELPIPAAAVWL